MIVSQRAISNPNQILTTTRNKFARAMGSLLRCCLKNCCDQDDDEDSNENNQNTYPSRQNRMGRITPERTLCQDPSPQTENFGGVLWARFWNHLTAKQLYYDQLSTTHQSDEGGEPNIDSPPQCSLLRRSSSTLNKSPLRRATSFDQSREILSIKTEEIVFPGSELQQRMAKKMCETLEEQGDECVICMDGFTKDNPRMPTLCGCGENKTYFHLPCLYQWIEQNDECPSCRHKLTWQEF